MSRSLIFLLILLCAAVTSNATIRRVGFTDVPPIAGIDYSSFYLAHQAAVNGDTIYVYPGKNISQNGWPTANARAEITKRLVIVGPGNWLDSSSSPRGNAGYQATKGIATFGNSRDDLFGAIFFRSGSDSSTIMGFDGQGQMIAVSCNNLTIKSNFNLVIFLTSDYINIANLKIEKNYRITFDGDANKAVTYSNLNIKNNFFYRFNLPSKSYTGIIANNTFANDYYGTANGGDLSMSYVNGNSNNFYQSFINLHDGSWVFDNNLMVFNQATAPVATPFVITGGGVSNFNFNVASQSTNFTVWPGNATGNVFISSAQIPNIFEGFPAIGNRSADNRYMLKAGSPAKANSAIRPGSTVDAGMFGGEMPYKLSTIPSIPSIYNINSPQGNSPTGNTLQINLSIRSNN